MARRLTLLVLLVLAAPLGCPLENPNLVSEECVGNTPPLIGNLEVNSYPLVDSAVDPPTVVGWGICFHVDWQDPGLDDAGNRGSDPPNMYGGLVSAELTGYNLEHFWLDEDRIVPGATEGEIDAWWCLEDSENLEDAIVDFAVRIRDRCDVASNVKTGTYIIGGGSGEAHQVENPELGATGCVLPAEHPCAQEQ